MTTIFAPITGALNSGVSVIRISGVQTISALKALGFLKNPEHQKIYFHKIIDQNNELIDEALISFFKAPNSLTGEDVAEIGIHSSPFILKKIFNILSAQKNVRFAEAGEFLKTAFLNGKIDLVQAEAVPDLIACETEMQHKQAIRQLQGELGKIYDDWRQRLIEILAQIEAFIDFPEDDLPQNLIDKIDFEVKNLSNEIKNHLNDNNLGQKIKNGLSLAILGLPNVGKSSLINFLAQSEVAIVSDIAGTTRDVLEIHLSIAGIPVKIADTAGLRKSDDKIEQEGVRRAIKKAEEVDIKILILDAINPIIPDQIDFSDAIVLANKIDLEDKKFIKNQDFLKNFKEIIPISINKRINLDIFIKKLEEKVLQIAPQSHCALITQERYRIALKDCLKHLSSFSLNNNIEIAAEDLRLAAFEIGKITGKIDIENILDVIFSRFCIGK